MSREPQDRHQAASYCLTSAPACRKNSSSHSADLPAPDTTLPPPPPTRSIRFFSLRTPHLRAGLTFSAESVKAGVEEGLRGTQAATEEGRAE
ncbi:unnamed protein product [Boreogadus saida]